MKRPKLEELTLTEKVAQLLMVSQFATYTKNVDGVESKRDKSEITEFMKKYQYGSLWSTGQLYMSNVNLTDEGIRINAAYNKRMVDFVGSEVRIPMLVGIDCESDGTGGVFDDGTSVSNALAIGAADDTELTFKLNAAIAREIRAAGANWRWAPVVDLCNRLNGISFGRTYSDDIDKTVKHAIAAIKGTESEKVVSTVKHFPGADPYEIRDAHVAPTMINISLEEWRNTQAKTFQGVFDAGVDSVMVGHTAFPAADDTMVNGHYLPATLSEKILKGILREEMGFDGVIITDGIGMGGLQNICSYEETLIRAINAGCDVLLGVQPYDFELVYNAVVDGRISMERIDESCERILKLKEKIGLFDDIKEEIDINEQSPITTEIDRQIAEKSITLLKDNNNLIPLNKEEIKNVTIICSSHVADTLEKIQVLKTELEKQGANVQIVEDIDNGGHAKNLADDSDLLLYCGFIGPHKPIGYPCLSGVKLKTYFNAFVSGKEKSIGVSMGYPYMHFDFMGGAETFFNIYSPSAQSLKAFVKVLYGEIEPQGKSPVDIEPKLRYVYC